MQLSLLQLECELVENFQNKKKLQLNLTNARSLQKLISQSSGDEKLSLFRVIWFRFFRIPFATIQLIVFISCSAILLIMLFLTFLNISHQFYTNHLQSTLQTPVLFLVIFSSFLGFYIFLLVSGVVNSRLGVFVGILAGKNTDLQSMVYLAGNIARIMVPFAINILETLSLSNDCDFSKIMINKSILSQVIKDCNRFLPICLLGFFLLKYFNCYSKLKNMFGQSEFRFSQPRSDEELIGKAREYIEKSNLDFRVTVFG